MKRLLVVLMGLLGGKAAAQPADFAALVADTRERTGAIALGAGWQGAGDPVIAQAGVTQIGGGMALAPDAPWHIGSITKGFTATLLMRLAEQGRLDFDAPLSALLPGQALHPDWAALTLPQILSHTGGLAPNFSAAVMGADPGPDLSAARHAALAALWSQPLPGTSGRHVYSNLGYVLAGHIAETVTGQPWESLIRSELAAPLGLTSLGFGAPQGAGVPVGHSRFLLMRRAAPGADNPALIGPAGTIHLSLRDLLAWGRFQLDACRGLRPDLLSQSGCERLHRAVTPGYGLGFAHFPLPGRPEAIIGHDGSNTMWYAFLMLVPERDLVIVLVTNDGRSIAAQRAAMAIGPWVLDHAP